MKIVYGPPDYQSLAPKHSYINARDFSSPKHLSEYLNSVSNNKSLYNSYLVWKRKQCIRSRNHLQFCVLCEKLNQMISVSNENQNQTKRRDLIEWWYDQAKCVNGKSKTIVTTTKSKTIQTIIKTNEKRNSKPITESTKGVIDDSSNYSLICFLVVIIIVLLVNKRRKVLKRVILRHI